MFGGQATGFNSTNTMVGGTPQSNNSGYNLNIGLGTLTPNTINGILCRSVARVTTPSLFVSVDSVVTISFFETIRFLSTDANWNGQRFVASEATFSSPGGRSQWIWDAPIVIPAAFIQGVTYECDIR